VSRLDLKPRVSLFVAVGLIVFFIAAVFASHSVHAQTPVPCTNYYTSSIAVPTGYGASYNLFSIAQELLVSVDCSSSSPTLTVGSNKSSQYIYKLAYVYQSSAWQPLSLTSGNVVAGTTAWWGAWGSATLPAANPSNPTYVVGYVCIWSPSTGSTGSQLAGSGQGTWKCGCADTTCSTGYWQLQAYQETQTQSTGGGSTGGGTSNGTLPAKIVGEWFWPYSGGATIATIQSQAPQINYLSLAGALSDGNEDGNVIDGILGAGIYASESQLQADIAAWKASGRVVVGVVGGDGTQPNANIKNSTDVSEFMASAVPIIDRMGYEGVDFDLESNPDPASLASLIMQLKAHYGSGFIIAMDPRPFNYVRAVSTERSSRMLASLPSTWFSRRIML
jgi:hypothetical protein